MVPTSLIAITVTWSLALFAFADRTLGHDGSTKDHYNMGYWTGCKHAGGTPSKNRQRCVERGASGSTWFYYVQCENSPGTIFRYEWSSPDTNLVPISPYDYTSLYNEPLEFTAEKDWLQALFGKSEEDWELFSEDKLGISPLVLDAFVVTNQGFKPGTAQFSQETDGVFDVLFNPDKSRETIAWDVAESLPFAQHQATIKQMLDAGIDGGLYLSCK